MITVSPDILTDAFALVTKFKALGLATRLAHLEGRGGGHSNRDLPSFLTQEQISHELLLASVNVKRAAAQIDEVVHSVGMLLCLTEILEDGETIEALSLGAGNTGKPFDLETDRRVAEFTFIDWKGGPESIRKQKLFKDYYLLAEAATDKRRYLYFLGDVHPLKVFTSKSPCKGMLRRFALLRDEFVQKYDPALSVSEYFRMKKNLVTLQNLTTVAPKASKAFASAAASEPEMSGTDGARNSINRWPARKVSTVSVKRAILRADCPVQSSTLNRRYTHGFYRE